MDALRKTPPHQTPRPFILPPEPVVTAPTTPRTPLPRDQKRSARPRLRPLLFILLTGFLLIAGLAAFILIKSVRSGEQMQFENATPHSFISQLKNFTSAFLSEKLPALKGEERGRINILLLGRAGEHYPGKNLTDTVMMMSINTETRQIALLSLPRDLYVPIGQSDYATKLNAVYQSGLSDGTGIEPLRQTIEEITGQPMDYFVTLDFDGFEKGIDTVGGIALDVVRDFNDPRYPGKNYSYEPFMIKKGWQTLDGATALKYVRERHNDPEGDFGRAKRQQQLIQAFKNKVFSLGTLFNVITVGRLIDTLGESVKTDMSLEDMARFLELSHTLDTKNVTNVVVDAWHKESLLRVSHLQVGDIAAFILVPRVGNWSELKEVSKNIFERNVAIERLQAVKNENATLTLFFMKGDQGAADKIAAFAREELGFSQVTVFPLPVVDNRPEKSIMGAHTGLTKPFSLDVLLEKFSLSEASLLPSDLPQKTPTDFTLIIGRDLREAFSITENTTGQSPEDDMTFSEALPPQPKRKK